MLGDNVINSISKKRWLENTEPILQNYGKTSFAILILSHNIETLLIEFYNLTYILHFDKT